MMLKTISLLLAVNVAMSAYCTCFEDGGVDTNKCGSDKKPKCAGDGTTDCDCVAKNFFTSEVAAPMTPSDFACMMDDASGECVLYQKQASCGAHLSAPHLASVTALAAVSGANTQYSVTYWVTASAYHNLNALDLTLVVTRGFGSASKPSFNTAWVTIPPNRLQTGANTITWTPQYTFKFASSVVNGQVTQSWVTPEASPILTNQQKTSWSGSAWGPASTDPTIGDAAISVYYAPTMAAHATVLSQDAQGNWVPFFQDPVGMATSTLTGVPQLSIITGAMRSVQTAEFIGTVSGTQLQTDFHDSTSKTVCVDGDNDSVKFLQGPCPSA